MTLVGNATSPLRLGNCSARSVSVRGEDEGSTEVPGDGVGARRGCGAGHQHEAANSGCDRMFEAYTIIEPTRFLRTRNRFAAKRNRQRNCRHVSIRAAYLSLWGSTGRNRAIPFCGRQQTRPAICRLGWANCSRMLSKWERVSVPRRAPRMTWSAAVAVNKASMYRASGEWMTTTSTCLSKLAMVCVIRPFQEFRRHESRRACGDHRKIGPTSGFQDGTQRDVTCQDVREALLIGDARLHVQGWEPQVRDDTDGFVRKGVRRRQADYNPGSVFVAAGTDDGQNEVPLARWLQETEICA